jgi:bisphosphoglycerate-dependent phosphoglycerate mutase
MMQQYIKLFEQINSYPNTIYLGNCTDVGCNFSKPITKYFPDATAMSNVVDDLNHCMKLDKEEFFNFIDYNKLPNKLKKNIEKNINDEDIEYWVRNYDSYLTKIENIDQCSFFWIYDDSGIDDIHYFFKRTK